MGLTPLFELFAGLLSFRLANRMQRIGWSCSSEKSNPRLPRQTGANRIVRFLRVLLQLTVKEGTISYSTYSIRNLYNINDPLGQSRRYRDRFSLHHQLAVEQSEIGKALRMANISQGK